MKKSEQRQNDILAFMKKTIASKGYSPTVREICRELDIRSTSTVHRYINLLVEEGLLDKLLQVGWPGLTASEAGRIGGLMAARRAARAKE